MTVHARQGTTASSVVTVHLPTFAANYLKKLAYELDDMIVDGEICRIVGVGAINRIRMMAHYVLHGAIPYYEAIPMASADARMAKGVRPLPVVTAYAGQAGVKALYSDVPLSKPGTEQDVSARATPKRTSNVPVLTPPAGSSPQRARRSPLRSDPTGAGRPPASSRPPRGRAVRPDGAKTMSVNLGSFTKSGDTFKGTITTLTIKAKLDLTPVEGGGDGSPAYRVQHSGREIGAAWVRRSRKNDAEFLNIRMQDPALGPTPVYMALVESTREPGTWALLLNEQRD